MVEQGNVVVDWKRLWAGGLATAGLAADAGGAVVGAAAAGLAASAGLAESAGFEVGAGAEAGAQAVRTGSMRARNSNGRTIIDGLQSKRADSSRPTYQGYCG